MGAFRGLDIRILFSVRRAYSVKAARLDLSPKRPGLETMLAEIFFCFPRISRALASMGYVIRL